MKTTMTCCLVVMLGGLLIACDDPNPQFGVTLSGDGYVVLHNPCRPTDIYDVIVESADGARQYWHVASDQGHMLVSVVLGEVPDGFQEVHVSRSAWPDVVQVVLTREPGGRSEASVSVEQVMLSEMRPDAVYVPRRGFMSFSDFDRFDSCG